MLDAQLAVILRFTVSCLIVFLFIFFIFIAPFDLGEMLTALPAALLFSFFISCFFIILTMVPGRLAQQKKAGAEYFILTVLVSTALAFLNIYWVGNTIFDKLMYPPPEVLEWFVVLLPILMGGVGGGLLFRILPAKKAHLYLCHSLIFLGGILTLCMIPLHFYKSGRLDFVEEFVSGMGIIVTSMTWLMGIFLRHYTNSVSKFIAERQSS